MLVSVLSGLARSDVDPWQEAAKLAQLPGETATKELAALIGALPDRAASYPDPRTIAARLIALLPRSRRFDGGPQQDTMTLGRLLKSRSVVDIRRLHVFRAGLAIPDREPPTAGQVGQRRSEGCQLRFSTGAAGEFRPVTAEWPANSVARQQATE